MAVAFATDARAYLVSMGAKQVNVHVRDGQPPRLSFKIKGKSFGRDIPEDDLSKGSTLLPELRRLISEIDSTFAARGVRAVKDISSVGARLRAIREERALSRDKLAQQTGIPLEKIKWLETTKGADIHELLTDNQITIITRECECSREWLLNGPPPIDLTPPDPEPYPDPEPPPPPIELDYATVGARVKEARNHLGWSQVALGNRIGYSGNSVWMLEAGRRTGLFDQLDTLAFILKCDVGWLTTGNGPSPTTPEPQIGRERKRPAPVLDAAAIGKRLVFARKRLGLSQTRLGDLLGTSLTTISWLERGKSPRSKYLTDPVSLAEILQVTPDWIITGTPIPKWETVIIDATPAVEIQQDEPEPAVVAQPAAVEAETPPPPVVDIAALSNLAAQLTAIIDRLGVIESKVDQIESNNLQRHVPIRSRLDMQEQNDHTRQLVLVANHDLTLSRIELVLNLIRARLPFAPAAPSPARSNQGRIDGGKRGWETRKRKAEEAAEAANAPNGHATEDTVSAL